MNLSFIIMKVTHLLSWYKKLHRYLSACEKIESGGKNLQVQQQHMWWSFLVQRRNMWDIYVDYILSNNILNKTMDHIIINVKILLYHLIEYNPFKCSMTMKEFSRICHLHSQAGWASRPLWSPRHLPHHWYWLVSLGSHSFIFVPSVPTCSELIYVFPGSLSATNFPLYVCSWDS